MILTLTPNPSIDRTVMLDGVLARGQVHRVASVTSQAGGKGVNISRAAVSAGIPSIAVVPARKDDPFVIELLSAGVDCRPIRPAGDVRVNLTITEPDGTTTKLNSPGAEVGPEHLEWLAEAILARAATADWTVLAGSLPSGAPAEFYADLVRRLRQVGGRVAVDTSEAPLQALVAALPGAAPDLMKPNGEELASFTGDDPDALEADPTRRREGGHQPDRARRGRGPRHPRRQRRGAGHRGRGVARHAAPHHCRQHRGCRRLQPVRLRARRHPGASRPRAPGPGRRLRQRRRRPARHHHPPALAAPHGAGRRHHPWRQRMTELITTDLVTLGADWGSDKHDVIRALAAVVDGAGRAVDRDQLIEDAFAREATSATGLPGGIAIPHCRTTGVEVPTLAFARLDARRRLRRQGRPGRPGLPDRCSGRRRRRPPDDPHQARPGAGQAGVHRRAARRRDRRGRGRPRRRRARRARRRRRPRPRLPHLPPPPRLPAAAAARRAPAAVRQALARRGDRLPDRHRPHLHGRRGPRGRRRAGRGRDPRRDPGFGRLHAALPRPPSPEAGAVIFAVDVGVRDRSRFAGKPMVSSGVKRPIDDADAMIAEALRYAADPASAPRVEGTATRGRCRPRAAGVVGRPRPAGC